MKNVVIWATFLILSVFVSFAQQYKVLYSFKGSAFSDGALPFAGLLRDSAGNLYGTTTYGGYSGDGCIAGGLVGCGTIFELSLGSGHQWTETILYTFCQSGSPCLDGASPEGSLVMDTGGNLFGTTGGGGSGNSGGGQGGGAVFKLSPPSQPGGAWTETVLYNFCSLLSGNTCLDGDGPNSNVIFDGSGNMYGTTEHGGSANDGTVFELSPGGSGWTETILHNFCTNLQGGRCLDGSDPLSGLVFDKSGNLYGTTAYGGTSDHPRAGGILFKLSPGSGSWTETVLANFNLPSGAGPESTPSFDAAGNLYGPLGNGGPRSDGALFQWNSRNGKIREVYFNGANGQGPDGAILVDALGRGFFGVTVYGGVNNPGSTWNGTAYQISPSGKETVLYNFCSQPAPNCTDGANPYAGLVEDSAGNLYGTTESGGADNLGVVFEITP